MEPTPAVRVRRPIRQWAALVATAALAASWIGPVPRGDAADPVDPACTIQGTPGPDVLVGTPGDDVICGRGGADRIIGRGGNDVLRGGRGADVLYGGAGHDVLFDGAGNDVSYGGAGRDLVRGGKGDDKLYGGPGSDTLKARDGKRFRDRVSCGSGRDHAVADEPDRVRADCEKVDQNDPPTDVTLDPDSIEENSPVGTKVGRLAATDADARDRHRFRLVAGDGGTDNDSFEIDGRSLLTKEAFDFETRPELSIRVRAIDRSGARVETRVAVSVTDVAEGPVVTAGPGSASYAEGDPPTEVAPGLTLTHPDTVNIESGQVTISEGFDAGDELQFVDQSGISGSYNTSTGVLTLSGTATIADYQAALRSVRYGTGSEDPSTLTRTVELTVTDGDGLSGSDTRGVEVIAVDDPPVAVDDSVTVAEDATATEIDVLANDTDVDGGPLSVESVTQAVHGVVEITGDGSGLSYGPDPDYCDDPPGTDPDTFDYTVNGGSTATVAVTVTCVADAPVVIAGPGSASYTEGDPATVIAPGLTVTDADGATLEGGQVTITENLDAGDELLFVDQSGISGAYDTNTGVLTLSGTATIADYRAALRSVRYETSSDDPSTLTRTVEFTVTDGDGLSGSDLREVEVIAIDGPPVALDDSAAVDEDSPPIPIEVLANDTDVDGGPILVEGVTQPDHGAVAIIADGGGVSYEPDPDYCNDPGVERDAFEYTLNGGSTAKVSVSVICIDDDPVAVDDAASVLLNASATTLDVLANDSDGDGGPILVDQVTQPSNGSVVITNGGADLTYEPDADYCNDPPGTDLDTFTYTLNGGSTATVSVTVACDTPPGAVDDSATVAEDSGASTLDVLANDTDPDGGPIAVQEVTQPENGTVEITNGGDDLTYEPEPDYCNDPPGTDVDTFTYALSPGGATATVSVTVTCVDDLPVAVDDSATMDEDPGATTIDVLANDTDMDAGPITVAEVTQPGNGTVLITNGGADLTYESDADYCNDPPGTDPDTFTYTLNGGSTATVSVTVTCVNDAPAAVADSFDAIGNTGLFAGTTRPDGEAGKEITGSVLSNDTDSDSPQSSLVVTAETKATTGGGTVTIEDDGNFSFHPDAGDATDSFTYTVSDGDASADGTVTLTITGEVWYVDNSEAPGGDGTSDTPFDTLAEAEAASGAGDTTFVHDGDDTSVDLHTGYQMDAGERLIGEVSGLSLDPDGGGSLPLSTLHTGTAGAHPTLTANNEDVVTLDDGNVVRGLVIDPAGAGGGIAGAAGDTGGGTIDDVRIIDDGTAGTQPGLELNGTSGTFDISNLSIDNKATGVLLNNADTVNFTASGTISITTTGGRGLDATGTAMGAGSVFDDITVSGSGSGGLSMVNTTGTTTFTNLSLTTTSGGSAAFVLSNAGGVTVPAGGTANLRATGGPAVDVTGTSGASLSFDDVDSTGSAGDGINLAGLGSGTFSAASGDITGAAGISFDLEGGSGAVTYPGTLHNGSGTTAVEITGRTGGAVSLSGSINDTADAGGGIVVNGNTGGSATFSGAAKVLNTGTQPAVAYTSSSGGSVSFRNGGLDIDTTSGAGLDASNAGAIDVRGTGNTIDTGSGRALRIAGTDITADDVTLQRVSSNGAVNGILLDTTGSSGGLTVTGTGVAPTGGTITNSSGPGVSLTSVGGGVSLDGLAVTNGGDDGIAATTVVDLAVVDSTVSANGNNHAVGLEERGLDYLNVTGTTQILRTTVSGADDSNAHIRNTTGGTTTLTVNASTFAGSKFNAGLRLRGEGASVMNATVTGSTFSANADPGFSMQTDSANTAQQTLLFNDNDVSGGSTTNPVAGRPQISINAGGNSTVRASVTNNDVKSAAGSEIILNTLASHTGTFDAKVTGNDIGDAQPGNPDALTDGGTGIHGWAHGAGVTRMEIRNNTVRNWGGRALELSHNDGTGTADYTVTGNVFSDPDASPNIFEGVYIVAGGAAGDSSNVCVDLENNDLDGIGRQGVSDIALDRFGSATLRFADFNDTSVPNLQTNLRGKNPASTALTVETFSGGPIATTATSCTLTSGTP
jgi:hypothetical protein